MKKLALLFCVSTIAISSPQADAAEKEKAKRMVDNDTMSVGGFWDSIKSLEHWKGSAEGGLNIYNGNTNSSDISGRLGVSHEYGRWIHSLNGEAFNREENDARTAERYRLKWNSDYKFTEKFFGFGEVEWVKDRFSGFNYRITETLGLGYIFLNDKTWYWDARAGVGGLHTEDETGDREDSVVGKLATNLTYNFNENVSFGQKLEAAFSEELETYRSETFVKSKFTKHLSFKAGYNVEKVTPAPDGRNKTDSHTFLGVVYDF